MKIQVTQTAVDTKFAYLSWEAPVPSYSKLLDFLVPKNQSEKWVEHCSNKGLLNFAPTIIHTYQDCPKFHFNLLWSWKVAWILSKTFEYLPGEINLISTKYLASKYIAKYLSRLLYKDSLKYFLTIQGSLQGLNKYRICCNNGRDFYYFFSEKSSQNLL